MVSTVAFIWHIRRAREPLLPPAIFNNGRFSLAALTSLASFISQGITFIALPFLFQSVYGYSPVVSALLFGPVAGGNCADCAPCGDVGPIRSQRR
ncbi:drug resistance MFS transporter, drug:H+ antiporter-2 (14 Spanner) (DHA2) family [Leclercia adecarboxylata]|uniref:Drug resistance MFS transporter, drug:H+ antiporter-2 (14 Spanner) (DHA2) family n=1 Tax=Leclercia adecarboxylata TaxID=83655 RepID=A0A4U9HU78_9ENTR|nr:drug resistance MFS transporter, drug:H+ antiporter-2 (14 Spanner) (DHA2) family [Leclercia adecarboxylata]